MEPKVILESKVRRGSGRLAKALDAVQMAVSYVLAQDGESFAAWDDDRLRAIVLVDVAGLHHRLFPVSRREATAKLERVRGELVTMDPADFADRYGLDPEVLAESDSGGSTRPRAG